ncbi:MAG: type II toxin-antitoxin system VapC family toxin [Terracidiphilus sp.]|jgi:ribonuclease VapC
MKIYILDASAVVRYLTNGIGEEKVAALIHLSHRREVRLLISMVNWGEVLYVLAGMIGLEKAISDLKAMSAVLESVAIDEELAEAAAIVKYQYKLGYADCYATALAMRMDATLVTSDPEFAKLGKKLKILALSRHSALLTRRDEVQRLKAGAALGA